MNSMPSIPSPNMVCSGLAVINFINFILRISFFFYQSFILFVKVYENGYFFIS